MFSAGAPHAFVDKWVLGANVAAKSAQREVPVRSTGKGALRMMSLQLGKLHNEWGWCSQEVCEAEAAWVLRLEGRSGAHVRRHWGRQAGSIACRAL